MIDIRIVNGPIHIDFPLKHLTPRYFTGAYLYADRRMRIRNIGRSCGSPIHQPPVPVTVRIASQMDTNLRRPRSIAELRERISRLRSAKGATYAASFRPRPSDVLIATYPKSGTTWMQQIVHGLRTGGDMDFDEITAAAPWIEMAHDMGIDLDADQAAEPRAFKTHWRGDEVPQGCRYIVVIRDPRDVAVSFYHFFEDWMFESGSIALDEFIRDFFIPGSRSGRYWEHLLSWWEYRSRNDTLLLSFEDMKADLSGTVQRVAVFLQLDVSPKTLDIATRQATIGFMKAHERQFDDHLLRAARESVCELPPGGKSSKVRAGRVGDHKQTLSPDIIDLLDGIWRETVGVNLGYPDYDALRKALSER